MYASSRRWGLRKIAPSNPRHHTVDSGICAVQSWTILSIDPPLVGQVPIQPAALETMIAARLAAHALLSSRLCGEDTLNLGELLGAAKSSNPSLLEQRVSS